MRILPKRLSTAPWLQKAVGTAACNYLRLVWNTSRFIFEPADLYDRVRPDLPVIVAVWHGQHFMTSFLKREEHRVKVLISRHRDGEINAIVAERLGAETIRGSGDHNREFLRKGGVGAFKAMHSALRDGYNIVMTADVPKVSRVAGLGIVMLARVSGRPIYPVAMATSRRVKLNSWDSSAVNLPFSRGAVVMGQAIRVDADATTRSSRPRAAGTSPSRCRDRSRLCARRREPKRRSRPCVTACPQRCALSFPDDGSRAVGAAAAFRPAQARQGEPARLGERRGEPGAARPAGPLVWVHGASVGEIIAVLPLVSHLCAQGFAVLVTSGTITSAELAEQRLPAGAVHQFVPLDVPSYRRAFPRSLAARASRFSSNRISGRTSSLATAERQIPLVLVNGRLSQRSFSRWRKLPQSIGAVLRRFDLCLAQSAADAERYTGLGAPRVGMTGNLKLDVPAPPAEPARWPRCAPRSVRAACDSRRFHSCRRRSGRHRCAPAASPPLPRIC